MLHFLTTTSLFVSLPNDCWCQVLGRPIHELIIRGLPVTPSTGFAAPKRGVDLEPGLSLRPTKKRRSPTDIRLVRARIFYSKPSRAPDGKIRAGLPRFRKLRPTSKDGRLTLYADVLNDLRRDFRSDNAARHALKYIFPSYYGLHNVFTSGLDVTNASFPFRDYTDRHDEILRQGKAKTPKRLRDLKPLSTRLLQLHCQTSYKRICDIVCPSKVSLGPL
ncbi:hypothetical protein CALCODRAFT_429824 [Calocera cornea HHB12733]|uniref:Uncharacterized protein n=1 Tax=Calocera cornea HHB12733 TaxID=1353952 RepID=A0A165I7G5_9BASI|nr:hypothetical protein CALCODRAFT_429824 [Calocera cornea HHB12733]